MDGLIALHRIAAARGDGLRPELLHLLVSRQGEAAQPNVTDIAAYRNDRRVQAGPNPVGTPDMSTAANVARLAAPDLMPSTAEKRRAR